jgi:hypothetical protein
MTLINPTTFGVTGSPWIDRPVGNLTAAGSNQGTAYVIPSGQALSVFTTVSASTGCILPASGVTFGEEYEVANHGTNALLVYPPVGGKMGNASANTAYSLAAGKTGYFLCVSLLQWTTNP